MKHISRRRALVGVGAAVAAGTGLMPRRARAAGELTVWWTQGFYKAENDAVIAWMADWEKRNNAKVNLTIMNGPDVITKLIAGMQVGDVPDVVHTVTGDRFLVPRAAWNDQLEDVSDVVDFRRPFESRFMVPASILTDTQHLHKTKVVETHRVLSAEPVTYFFDKWTTNGYDGLLYRLNGCPYTLGKSKNLLHRPK